MATVTSEPTNPIYAGFEWRELVTSTVAIVPAGSTLRGAVRIRPESPPVFILSTADGTLLRNDDFSFYVIIPADVSKDWPPRERAYIDFVRTDLPEEVHLGFALMIQVAGAVTLSSA